MSDGCRSRLPDEMLPVSFVAARLVILSLVMLGKSARSHVSLSETCVLAIVGMSLATRLSCELVICPLSELSAGMNDTGNAVPEVICDVLGATWVAPARRAVLRGGGRPRESLAVSRAR